MLTIGDTVSSFALYLGMSLMDGPSAVRPLYLKDRVRSARPDATLPYLPTKPALSTQVLYPGT